MSEDVKEREGQSKNIEREFETGKDERSAEEQLNAKELFLSNQKLTYDQLLEVLMTSVRNNATHVQKLLVDAAQFDNARQVIANQALNKMVENGDMFTKQAYRHTEFIGTQGVRHGDLSIDRQWNVDEQGYTVQDILQDQTFKDGIAAAVSVGIADAIARIGTIVASIFLSKRHKWK